MVMGIDKDKEAQAAYDAFRNYMGIWSDTPFDQLSPGQQKAWGKAAEAAIEEWESNFDPPE